MHQQTNKFLETKKKDSYGTGISSIAHCGKIGIAKNFNPTKNDGANIDFPISKNSDSVFLLKHPASMLNTHLTTFSVVNRRPS